MHATARRAPAELVPGLPAYSLPSIIEGEFNTAAARSFLLDGRMQEINLLLTSLKHSVDGSANAVNSRLAALDETSISQQAEIEDIHTHAADHLDCIAELESQVKDQQILLAQLGILHNNLLVRFETHLKDFQQFNSKHFRPIPRHVIAAARCSFFSNDAFVQSPVDEILYNLLNSIIQQGVSSQDQVPVPVPDPST